MENLSLSITYLDGVLGSNENRANRTDGTESEIRRRLTPQYAKSVAESSAVLMSRLHVTGDSK